MTTGGFLTKTGNGTLVLNTANTYLGTTTINRGTLALTFSSNQAITANIISASSALVINGASLTVFTNATTSAQSQTFASTTVGVGLKVFDHCNNEHDHEWHGSVRQSWERYSHRSGRGCRLAIHFVQQSRAQRRPTASWQSPRISITPRRAAIRASWAMDHLQRW